MDRGWWLLLTLAFLPWIKGKSQINRDNELCQEGLNDMDLYVLYPTSAFVNTTRLVDIKRLTRSAFFDNDFGRGLRIHTMLYKRQTQTVLHSGSSLDKDTFFSHFSKVKVKSITNVKRKVKPTYATLGLKYFFKHVSDNDFSGSPDPDGNFAKPVMLLFYVIEDLHPRDLQDMVQELINITRSGNIFVMIVIGNPNGTSFKNEATIAVPHEEWNALAIDDSGDLMKYTTLLRKSMCRFSQRKICLVTAEAEDPKIDKSADPLKNAMVNPLLSKSFTVDALPAAKTPVGHAAIHIAKKLNTCCGEYVFSPAADDGLQKCCDTSKTAKAGNVVMIDDYEEEMNEDGSLKDVCDVAAAFKGGRR